VNKYYSPPLLADHYVPRQSSQHAEVASLWRRFPAALIDGLIMAGIGLALFMVPYGPYILPFVYFTLGQQLVAGSFAKKILGIEVHNIEGGRANVLRGGFLRYGAQAALTWAAFGLGWELGREMHPEPFVFEYVDALGKTQAFSFSAATIFGGLAMFSWNVITIIWCMSRSDRRTPYDLIAGTVVVLPAREDERGYARGW
jgi:uncharacterized RDD family membrane protein YckC